jgi:hypothetical protein
MNNKDLNFRTQGPAFIVLCTGQLQDLATLPAGVIYLKVITCNLPGGDETIKKSIRILMKRKILMSLPETYTVSRGTCCLQLQGYMKDNKINATKTKGNVNKINQR